MNITNLNQLKQILNQYYYNSNVVLKTLLYKFIRYKLNTDFIKDQIYEYISDPANNITFADFLKTTHVDLVTKEDIFVLTKLIQFYISKKKYRLQLSTQDILNYGITSFEMLFQQICNRYKLSILKDVTTYKEINNQLQLNIDDQFIYPKHKFLWNNNLIYIDTNIPQLDYRILLQSHIIGSFNDDIAIITKYNVNLTSYILNQIKKVLSIKKIYVQKDTHLLMKISG